MNTGRALDRVITSLPGLSLGTGLVCLLLSLAVMSLLSQAVGVNPAAAIGSLAVGALGSQHAIISTLRETAPLILCGLAFLLPFKTGFFNVGGQGHLEIGALAAVAIALWVKGPAALVLPLALGAAASAGVLLILLPLVLKLGRGTSEVTTTIMSNFAAIQFSLAMVTGPMKAPGAWFGTTLPIPARYRLPLWFGIHIGIWLVIIVALVTQWVLKRTVFGFHLSAAGANPSAATAAGIPVNRVLGTAVCVAGALAGLAGGIQALAVIGRVAEGWSKPWGFLGILAALLGGSPLGVVPAAFLLAILETGARHMQAMTGVPAALVFVMQALPVLFFLTIRATPLVRRLSERAVMVAEHGASPGGLERPQSVKGP